MRQRKSEDKTRQRQSEGNMRQSEDGDEDEIRKRLGQDKLTHSIEISFSHICFNLFLLIF